MSARALLRGALLMFVAASVAALAVREFREAAPGGGARTSLGPADAAPGRAVIACYFAGRVRCASCRKIEALSRKAVEEGFPREVAAGRVRFLVVNVDEAGNRHYVEEYGLDGSALVLVATRDGKTASWRKLPEVWTLLADEARFLEYVRANVASGLKGAR